MKGDTMKKQNMLLKPRNTLVIALLSKAGSGAGTHRKGNKSMRLAGKRELARDLL
jgi:hypothetical protein